MASKATKNRTSQKTNARASKSAPQSNNRQNRPHVATRSPIEQLTQVCAQQANRAKGQIQQEWFALGSWVAQFRASTPALTETSTEAPRAMAAGAGA